jgi:hypothetical protein
MRFDPIPQARVVREAGQLMAPPRAPRVRPARRDGESLRDTLALVVRMWPISAMLLLMLVMLIMAGAADLQMR